MAKMELKLDRVAFLSALHKAQGVVDRKSTVNVLSHVLLEATSDATVRMTATDYDVVLQADIPAEVLEAGAACINGKSLFDVVKTAGDATIHLQSQANHWIEVTAGRSRFKLAGIPAQDFPEITLPDDISWVGLPRVTLKDLVEKTSFSVSDDETRMNLNGVLFKIDSVTDGGDALAKLVMVSTDGHRLSKVETSVEAEGYDGQAFEAIVHKKGASEVRRLLDGEQDLVEVGFARGRIVFRAEQTLLTVRQIEDTYPDFQRVIPASSAVKLPIERDRLLSAVKRIAVLTSNRTYIVKLELSKGQLALTSSTPDYGEGRDEIDVDYDGDGMVIGFNYTYLLDVLGVIRGDLVTLEFSNEDGPTLITAPAEPGALFVVMPMRI